MKTTADVVVIGGGIQGVSAIYHLVEAGVKNVQLVEMDEFGSGTTAYTASWFVMQAHLEPNIRLSQYSLQEFLTFREKLGVEIGFKKIGSLSINTIEHAEEMRESGEYQKKLGVPIDILSADDIKKIAPFLNTSDIGIGLLCEADGLLDASIILNTYVKHARLLGATLDEGVKALSIDTAAGKVIGVNTTKGFISTPVVVNAAGIYDKVVAKWAGIDLPTVKAIRHTFLTKPTTILPKNMPLIESANPEPLYLRREGEAASYSIGLDETESFVHAPNLFGAMDKYGDHLLHRMPDIAQLDIVQCTAGIRSIPITSQQKASHNMPHVGQSLPIIGPVEELFGYYNDCAWGGLGIAHSPAGGKLIAECVCGLTHSVDITPFLLKRYF